MVLLWKKSATTIQIEIVFLDYAENTPTIWIYMPRHLIISGISNLHYRTRSDVTLEKTVWWLALLQLRPWNTILFHQLSFLLLAKLKTDKTYRYGYQIFSELMKTMEMDKSVMAPFGFLQLTGNHHFEISDFDSVFQLISI